MEKKTFIDEAPDSMYLAAKVILLFGISGALCSNEIYGTLLEDVEDTGNKYLVYISNDKNKYPGYFIIKDIYYQKVKDYIDLRPSDYAEKRFFIKYLDGKCICQPMSLNMICQIPCLIATYLGLENPSQYTANCFRRSALTLISEAGADITVIKKIGRWHK